MMSEWQITINGRALTTGQAMTVRVALESFALSLRDGLGDDEHGKAMTAAYIARVEEIRGIAAHRTVGFPLDSPEKP